MALDTFEIISAALREGPIAAQVQSMVAALPPVTPERPRKAVDFAGIIGAAKGSTVYKVLEQFGRPVASIEDVVVNVLGLDVNSPFGQQAKALDILIADIKD